MVIASSDALFLLTGDIYQLIFQRGGDITFYEVSLLVFDPVFVFLCSRVLVSKSCVCFFMLTSFGEQINL